MFSFLFSYVLCCLVVGCWATNLPLTLVWYTTQVFMLEFCFAVFTGTCYFPLLHKTLKKPTANFLNHIFQTNAGRGIMHDDMVNMRGAFSGLWTQKETRWPIWHTSEVFPDDKRPDTGPRQLSLWSPHHSVACEHVCGGLSVSPAAWLLFYSFSKGNTQSRNGCRTFEVARHQVVISDDGTKVFCISWCVTLMFLASNMSSVYVQIHFYYLLFQSVLFSAPWVEAFEPLSVCESGFCRPVPVLLAMVVNFGILFCGEMVPLSPINVPASWK